MKAADGTQIGWGVAAGSYPSMMPPSVATLRINANGSPRFATSGHEMGQGIRTAIAAILVEGLDISTGKLEVVIGDTTAAPQHMTAGSWGTAGAIPGAAKAVERMRAAVAELLESRQIAGNLHQQLASVRRPFLQVEVFRRRSGPECRCHCGPATGRVRGGWPRISGFHYHELHRKRCLDPTFRISV
ncbi:molybdopterin cofactor-binding domain-containing protein [Rhizobium leguminosarum]|uniref:molybdopterin cofactor-binding domain-containing protein n=1 Tax=Rhizobium leguminosarum TaxID=384 RepID=UPI0032B26741